MKYKWLQALGKEPEVDDLFTTSLPRLHAEDRVACAPIFS